ncbi:MAG: hypothetical protein IH914_08535 [candidate division Zixibacteria bacterium]|nr:hypothetical protein [candidate division Zixibacteria bacterium]
MKHKHIFILALTLSLVGRPAGVNAGQVETKNAEKLTISGYTQARFVYDDAIGGSRVNNAFFVRRNRLKLAAEMSERTTMTVQVDFASSAILKDAYVTFSPGKNLKFTAGQFKRPVSQEALLSASKTPTLDKGLTDEFLVGLGYAGRDQGLMASISDNQGRINLMAGIFSGAGERNVSKGDNLGAQQTELQNRAKDFAARLVYIPKLATGSFQIAGNVSVRTAGASSGKGVSLNQTGGVHKSESFVSFGGDASLKLDNGFAVFVEAFGGDNFSAFIDTLSNFNAPTFFAGHIAALYHAKLKNSTVVTAVQPELRFESFDKNTDVSNDRESLLSVGMSIFFGKNVRWRNNIIVNGFEDDTKSSHTQFGSELQGLF